MTALSDILNLMTTDDDLMELVDGNIRPIACKGEGCSYKYYQLTNDAIKAQSRLELRVHFKDLTKCYKALEIIDSLIITRGDTPLSTNILSCVQNGGSSPLFDWDSNIYTITKFYSIIERKK